MTGFSIELAKQLLNSQDQFPVDFNEAWQWLGISKKNNAKRNFEACGFLKGTDYKVLLNYEQNLYGGRPGEIIKLSIDCFKMWGMMSRTEQGRNVREYFLECEKIAKATISNPPQPKVSPYLQRIEHFNLTEENIPLGYWCIFGEMTNLLGKISLQYPVSVYDLVDGSVGKHWSNYRKNKDWATERRQYLHVFPDNRGERLAWCYHLQELMYFRIWYEEVYRIDYLPQYLLKKYGELVLQK
jgi:phage anti-repressor protein